MAPLRFDLSRLALSPETRALLPLHADEPALVEQRAFGTWWIAPFARTIGRDLVGFRLVPGQRVAECPVAWAAGPAVVTVASRAEYAVPMVVFREMLRVPRRWLEASELLEVEWEELRSAHRALGGGDELVELRAIATDSALRASCATQSRARDAAVAAIVARLDPSPETIALQRAVEQMRNGEDSSSLAGEVGCWRAAFAALALDLVGDDDRALAAAWAIFEHPPGLDMAWAARADVLPSPDATASARVVHAAARLLATRAADAPAAWRADPRWSAVVALGNVTDPYSYDGLAFLEAAAALDERGEPEGALAALAAVPFWSFLADGPAFDEVLEAAQALAQRQGWAHLATMTRAILTRP
jgi:hypothetical protein